MTRATVLHCVEEWGGPADAFVADLVAATTATRAVVMCSRRSAAASPTGVPVREVGWCAPHPDARRRDRRMLRGALVVAGLADRVSVLHAHSVGWAPHVARAAAELRRPWALTLRSHDLLTADLADPALRSAGLVVVPSQVLAETALARGFPGERVRVIAPGVDLASLPWPPRHPREGEVVVTLAGPVDEPDGLLAPACALAGAVPDLPGLRVRVLAPAGGAALLRAGLGGLGLDAEVVNASPSEALARTDLLLVQVGTGPRTEGLTRLAAQAQAAGVPVVLAAADPAAVAGVVAADAGRVVPAGDERALRAALVDLARAPERWAAMGRAGRRHAVLRFELGARAAELEEQYAALTSTGAPAPPAPPAPAEWPRVSVVVATHNRRALLAQALDTLEAQTYPADRVEVVVVDDGSTDDTSDELARRPRVRALRQPRKSSAAQARNRALREATGDVVAFTDDDCRPVPTWLEALVAAMAEGVALVQGRTAADPSQPLTALSRTQWTPHEYGLYETANMAYRRDALLAQGEEPFQAAIPAELARILGPRIGGQAFGEDTELAWRVKRAGGSSRFAARAVVHHHVYDRDIGYLFRRALLAAGFPLLVRRVPELRSAFLWQRVFLSPRQAALVAALAALPAARRRPGVVVAAAPYVWLLTRPHRPGVRGRLAAAPVLAARDLVELAALAYGSARARTPVL